MSKSLCDALESVLLELLEEDLKRFKKKLEDVELEAGYTHIPRGRLEKAVYPIDLVSLLIDHYTERYAVQVTMQVLNRINRKDLLEKLNKVAGQSCVTVSKPQAGVPSLYLEALTIPPPSTAEPDSTNPAQSPYYPDNVNLKWVQWSGTLPKDAVSIYNSKYSRTDYVARFRSCGGFYTPSKGSYCHYPISDKEEHSLDFKLLVNEDNFEPLEWRAGTFGSVPNNAVKTNPEGNVFVGRNKYGLGKVVPKFNAFFLPCDGKEYCYNLTYEVLSIVNTLYSQEISDVHFRLEEKKLTRNPEKGIQSCNIVNNEDQHILKIVQLSFQGHRLWDIKRPIQAGVTTTITAQVPVICGEVVNLTQEKKYFRCSQGTTLSESEKQEVRFEVTVAPRNTSTVQFEGVRVTVDIPFTARLSRTYSHSDTRHTSISGVYRAVQILDVKAVVE